MSADPLPSTSASRTCKTCGGFLPPDAPGGNCPACLWELVSKPPEDDGLQGGGRRIGSYLLIGEVARGGMGAVWRARHEGLGREVALKLILGDRLATTEQVLRFHTEARAAARLDHPNIVPIYEIGEDDGRHFYTMRLVEEGSLADRMQRGPPLSPRESARIVALTARAIHFAHQRGVLHRDVKPSNILLDKDLEPRVGDFGLARIDEPGSSRSRTGWVLGTPAYMAPEQASGLASQVTTAADVYGLGAVLYELLTGVPPFDGETPFETIRRVLEAGPVPPRSRNPGIHRDLDIICRKCLQKEPEKRYASAAELADDLERWLGGLPILARPVSGLARLLSWARRRRELAAALSALVVLIPVAFSVTLWLLIEVRGESEARAAALRSEEGQRLAYQSLTVLGENPGQALLLALEADRRAPSLSANSALLAAVEACRERRRLLGHTGAVVDVRYSPDGKRVVTASYDRTARVWDVATGGAVAVLRGHTEAIESAAFGPDGARVVTSSRDGTARVWDASTGESLLVLPGSRPMNEARFSPDGSRILTLDPEAARIWDSVSGRPVHVLGAHPADTTCAVFSPDGTQVVVGAGDGVARCWDSASGRLLGTLSGHGTGLLDVAFSADGRRIATASDPEARVWDASSHRALAEIRGHSQGIYSLALTSDGGKLVTGSEDFTARVWDASTGKELYSLRHGHKIIRVEIFRDALFLTASYDKVARVWDLRDGRLVAEMRGHAAPLYAAAFSPGGEEVATGCVDFTARLWKVGVPEPFTLQAPDGMSVISGDVAAGGRKGVQAFFQTSTLHVVDLPSCRVTARLEGHSGVITMVRFSPDGARVLSVSEDGTARLWSTESGRQIHVLSGHEGGLLLGSFSPDGRRVLTLSQDRTARVWSAESGREERVYRGVERGLYAGFGPDSDQIFLLEEYRGLQIGRISSGELSGIFPELSRRVNGAALCPDGARMLLALRTTKAQVRAIADGSLIASLIHPSRVAGVTYSPDGRWIGTLDSDGVGRIWDASTHEELLNIARPGKLTERLHFPHAAGLVLTKWFPDGARDQSGAEVLVYPLDVRAAALRARFADLTPDERENFKVGSPEERREYRSAWRGGDIFGEEAASRP